MNVELLRVDTHQPEWESIRSIRYQVFVVEQEVDEQEEYDEFEVESRHFLALVDGKPCGTARWRQTAKGFKLERFAVLKEFRGKKVGEAILKTVLNEVIPLALSGAKPIYLHAQIQAMPFYTREGFVAYGEEFEEANIRHLAMHWQPKA